MERRRRSGPSHPAAAGRMLLLLLLLLGALTAVDCRWVRQAPVREEPQEGEGEGEGEGSGAPDPLGLPANASALLPGPAADTFRCDGRAYGYYADPDNGCQVFHVCWPVQLPSDPPGGPPSDLRYSFVCPAETVFNQESFTCTRPEDAAPCEEAPNYYHLNDALGATERPGGADPEPGTADNAL